MRLVLNGMENMVPRKVIRLMGIGKGHLIW